MRYKVLKELKPYNKRTKSLNFGFDTETYQISRPYGDEQVFYMGSVYGKNINFARKYGDNKDAAVFWDKHDMANFIYENVLLRKGTLWALNLDFDFHMTFDDTDVVKHFKITNINGKARIIQHKNNKRTLKMLDVANHLGFVRLEKLGSLIGVPKLPEPACFTRKARNEEEKRELIAYNIRDSEICALIGDYLSDYYAYMKCKMHNTVAKTGIDYLRRHSFNRDIICEREEWIPKHYEGSLRGGRTETIKRGYFEDIKSYDFNSFYPSMCKEGLDGKGSFPDPSTVHYNKKQKLSYIETYDGITKVKIKAPDIYTPFLGVKHKGKLLFPTGNLEGWFTNQELVKAMNMGYEIQDIDEGLYYTDRFIPFRKAVERLYKIRRQFKDDKNDLMAQLCKTQMNSGMFGKLGQRISGFESTIHADNCYPDEAGNLFYTDDNDNEVMLNDWVSRGEFIYERNEEIGHIGNFIHPILASTTTALARTRLWEHIHKVEDDFVYCDTDSLKVIGRKLPSSEELGALGYEYTADKAIFIKAKMYYVHKEEEDEHELKLKGVGKEFTIKDFLKQSQAETQKLIANTKRFTSYKESFVRKIPYGSIISKPKVNSLEDSKRKWSQLFNWRKSQDSEPHKLKMW